MTYSNNEDLKKEFSELTIEYLKNADLEYRKKVGQYFTPKTVREKLLSKIPKNIVNPKVIDPACGTGEFLTSANSYFDSPEIFGLDIDNNLVNLVKDNYKFAKIAQADALKKQFANKYDVVIGNPPYFEFKPEDQIKSNYSDVIGGRPNIFSLFIKLGIDLLKEGGYLAYVVPPSMNNGAYFSKLRSYIVNHTNIEYMEILDDSKLFHSAQQTTMLLVLKKGKNKGDYLFSNGLTTIFSENVEDLKNKFSAKTTLRKSGYRVNTGQIVWNQNRKLLTNDPDEGELLVWAHNITEKGLLLNNKTKQQYIVTNKTDIGPAIVVNRIVGKVKGGSLRAALIPNGKIFLAENHVNVIKYTNDPNDLSKYEWLLDELKKEENLSVLKFITGNTQLSKNELENLFPIEYPQPSEIITEQASLGFGGQMAIA